MKSIEAMIAEYRVNVRALKERQQAIAVELRRTRMPQARSAMQCRIDALGVMIVGGNRMIYEMQQYLLAPCPQDR